MNNEALNSPVQDPSIHYAPYSLIQFTLYSRSYCHLCEDMLKALQVLQQKHLFSIEVIDVDSDNALIARYDELVPVLLAKKDSREPVQLCHYFLNDAQVEAFLLDEAAP